MANISLRELKKARSKLAIYEASLELIGKSSFREVRLEEICAAAEVSKVTFFKFFPQKEDVLVYFMYVWLLQRMLEIEDQGLKGVAAIRHILRQVAEGHGNNPGLMLSLIAFLAESKMHPCMPKLSNEEYELLFGEAKERAKSLRVDLLALFYQLVQEAKEAGECTRQEDSAIIAQWLATLFYGAYLTAHTCSRDVMRTYEEHLKLLLS